MENIVPALEILRAACYAVGVLAALYVCIEAANRDKRALAGSFGTLSVLYMALLVSVAARYLGIGEEASRALITPGVVLQVAALCILVWEDRKDRRVWPFKKRGGPPGGR